MKSFNSFSSMMPEIWSVILFCEMSGEDSAQLSSCQTRAPSQRAADAVAGTETHVSPQHRCICQAHLDTQILTQVPSLIPLFIAAY